MKPVGKSLCAAALAAALLAGCGTKGEPTYRVKGNVSFDSEPVPEGTLIFYPKDGPGDADVAKIKDGQYETRVKAGEKRVEIMAQRAMVPEKIGPLGGPEMEQYIPAEFNRNSELTADIQAANDNQVDFTLEKK